MLILFLGVGETAVYSQQQQRKDTLVVTRDGTGDYRNIQEAVEAVRAFMDYTVTIYIKNGTYKEKLVIPSWVKNVQLVGESAENTIITYDDHANINKMGTFRTYTVKVSGNDITFKDLTIENNAASLGQAVGHGSYLPTATSKVLPILSSDLPLHFSNTVSCIANVIRISLPLLLLKI